MLISNDQGGDTMLSGETDDESVGERCCSSGRDEIRTNLAPWKTVSSPATTTPLSEAYRREGVTFVAVKRGRRWIRANSSLSPNLNPLYHNWSNDQNTPKPRLV